MIIGTAGHVDHGKTELTKVLTGIDTDRFHQEKERGISIDIGFAPLHFSGGRTAGLIDVPGHEKFIHNMLAGVGGIDLVLMVIDATEGVMPQTREHLDILGLLGIKKGVVAITKKDLVDSEWLEMVAEEVSEYLQGTFLAGAPIHTVSSLTGEGIPALKSSLEEMYDTFIDRDTEAPLRIPLDRSFTISGFGTVVTGTLLSGKIGLGQTVEILPPGRECRVRGIQVFGNSVEQAFAGQRVAVNLAGLEKKDVQRGSVLAAPGYFHLSRFLDARLKLLPSASKPLVNMTPVHFYLGTTRLVARLLLLGCDMLEPGKEGLVQCRLDKPLVAGRGDLFIIRSYSPMITIGGGTVLDERPLRHKRFKKEVLETLQKLNKEDLLSFILQKMSSAGGTTLAELAKLAKLGAEPLRLLLQKAQEQEEIVLMGDLYITAETLEKWIEGIRKSIDLYHREKPLSPGISKAHLGGFMPRQITNRAYDAFLTYLVKRELIKIHGELVSRFDFSPKPIGLQEQKTDLMKTLFQEGGLSPAGPRELGERLKASPDEVESLLDYLVYQGAIIKVSEDYYLAGKIYQQCLEILKDYFLSHQTITLGQYRDLIKGSRKIAQSLLEHYDGQKYTKRVGDERIIWKMP